MVRKDHHFALWLLLLGTAVAVLLAVAVVVHFQQRPDDPESLLYSLLRRDGLITGPDWPLAIHVKDVRGRTLVSPVLKWKDKSGEVDTVMVAREGELRVAGDSRELLVLLRFGSASSRDGTRVTFDERSVTVALPADFGEKQ
jgi:hypothetical protein